MKKYISKSESGLFFRLEELGFSTYRDYIESKHWITIRNKFYSESKKVKEMYRKHGHIFCEFCKNTGKLNLYHASYKRLGKERSKDLLIICDLCHKLIHSLNRKYDLYERTKQVRRSFVKGIQGERSRNKLELMR